MQRRDLDVGSRHGAHARRTPRPGGTLAAAQPRHRARTAIER
ncbi:hypothetical protein COLSTE_01252 [Collinsella stercoris DSM 13279]|uniref:Uncharacterized protein n=1 Tax=Collinsella stercoris DSM 13279 TaxID=445975 RepID=B6GB00_9ACTN|nr:hypothetical protein COLSTE_01252 [Collinsella stercoris DSM 13279]